MTYYKIWHVIKKYDMLTIFLHVIFYDMLTIFLVDEHVIFYDMLCWRICHILWHFVLTNMSYLWHFVLIPRRRICHIFVDFLKSQNKVKCKVRVGLGSINSRISINIFVFLIWNCISIRICSAVWRGYQYYKLAGGVRGAHEFFIQGNWKKLNWDWRDCSQMCIYQCVLSSDD